MPIDDIQNLAMSLNALAECLGFLVKTGASKIFSNISHFIMLGDSKPKIIIHAIMKFIVEQADLVQNRASYKDRRLANKTSLNQPFSIKRLSRVTLNDVAILLDVVPFAINGPNCGVFLQKRHCFGDGSRKVNIIRIKPSQIGPLGAPPAFVYSVRLPPIFLGDPFETANVRLEHVQGLIH